MHLCLLASQPQAQTLPLHHHDDDGAQHVINYHVVLLHRAVDGWYPGELV